MKKILKRLLLILLVLAVPIGLWAVFSGSSEEETQYRTSTVTRGDIAEVVTANGTLNPTELVSVGTQVSGQINNIYVKLNDEVTKGQLLAEIDPAIPAAQLKQSKANLETSRTALELARRNLERTRNLVAKEYVPRTELENSEQNYKSLTNSFENAKTQVERDEVNLGYTRITAPINGVIISQEVTAGQTMAANFQTPNLFKIAGDLSKMKIDVNFSEADISKVKVGMPVSFTVDAFAEKEFPGVVDIVNLNPNNQSGVVTYSVTVAVENEERSLLPGMTAFVRVILSERKDILRVPAAALRFTPPVERSGGITNLFQFGMRSPRPPRGGNMDSAKQTVHVLENGNLKPIEVTVGSTDDTYVEVKGEGLVEGATVVTGLMPVIKR